MNKRKLSQEQFSALLGTIKINEILDYGFLYEVYDLSFSAICGLIDKNILNEALGINSYSLMNYIIGEYTYALSTRSDEEKKIFLNGENTPIMMAAVVSDKYMTMDYFPSKEKGLSNKFLPPISSLDTFLNFMINMLNKRDKNSPSNTLVSDLLNKSLSIARCILELLVNGFETEAMALWRTLHECECILKLLNENGQETIDAYIKHMNYSIAYRNGLGTKDETDKIFEQIKNEMKSYDLKSKDIKKYIEYGWLYSTKEYKEHNDIKLNFRNGLETLAGLQGYSKLYEQTSEIVHSTPMLIYSSRIYYYLTALINTYESFFRVEIVFKKLFDEMNNDFQKAQYENMRRVYYSQLLAIHKNESSRLKKLMEK